MEKNNRFKIFIAAYLVLIKDGQILLSKRANTGYQDGNFGLVSGHFDGAETAKQCIAREAKEEVGITIKPDNLKVVHVMHRYRPEREYIDIYLESSVWDKKLKNMEPHKCEGIEWFPIEELPDNTIPEIKLALDNIKKKSFYGEIGW